MVSLLLVLGGFLLGWNEGNAIAADVYPSKPIAYTVFHPPGGKIDLTARLVAPYLQKYIGGPVVVTNTAGGAEVIGHKIVRESAPDGYTLGFSGGTIVAQYTKPGISLKDYTWIARVYGTPYVIAIAAALPFKSLRELVDFAKANPKKLKHASMGVGVTNHLASASFEIDAGIEYTQVVYKGEGPAVVGLASGEVDLLFGTIAAAIQMIEAGKVRILAVCGPKRMEGAFAQIPTCKEAGYDFNWDTSGIMFGPKGLQENRAVFTKISEAARRAILDPELGQRMRSVGFDIDYSAGDDLMKWMNTIDQKTKKIVYELGLQHK